jgi:glutaredoxin
MFCSQAKGYLSQKSVQFEDKDITKNAQALEELKKFGYMTTPVVVIDSSVIVGFDAEKIDAPLR